MGAKTTKAKQNLRRDAQYSYKIFRIFTEGTEQEKKDIKALIDDYLLVIEARQKAR